MTVNVLARMVTRRAPSSSNRVRSRSVATQSRKQATPSIAIRSHDYESLQRKAPASGWIVSSSSTMTSDDTTAPSFFVKKGELKYTTEDLKLEVDMEELQQLASMRCTPLSLKDMYKYAVDFNDQEQRLRNAQFLHKELPVRIAQRAVDLLTLPHGLSEALPIKQIAHMYLLHLEKFQELPVPTTPEEEDEFTALLQSIVLNRTSIPMAIARGLNAWRKSHTEELEMDRFHQMEEALYRFFTARVGLRFLTEHHILTSPRHASRSLLRKSQSSFAQDNDFLGCIQTDCDPIREVEKIVETVTLQTQDHFGVCPEIQIVDSSQNEDSKFTYVPHHLHYMVGELLKNSCRATVKR
jgi:pyruvate dehydrogenase kinase 2/3/4